MALDPNIVIVGCGPGAAEYLTRAAQQAIAGADTLVGSPRLQAMFPQPCMPRINVGSDIEAVLRQIAQVSAQRRVVVLVSGDPGVCSLARLVMARFGRAACRVIPGISSVQMAFARLGLDWADAHIVSAHGREAQATPDELRGHDKVLIFAGTTAAMLWITDLATQLHSTHAAILCENLTLPNERVIEVPPADLPATAQASLATVLLIRRSLLA